MYFFRFLAFHFTTPSSSCLQLRIWNFFVKKVNGFWLTIILQIKFFEKNNTTGRDSFVYFDQNFGRYFFFYFSVLGWRG